MSRWANGLYTITNPEKYVGKNQPRYRSGWEHSFMRFCDNNKAVLQWASESIAIPYKNPITGKNSMYVPDFFITYRTRGNQQRDCGGWVLLRRRWWEILRRWRRGILGFTVW